MIAVYDGDELVGVLLADVAGEERPYRSLGKTIFVRIFDFFRHLLYSGGVGVYDAANQEMYREYLRDHQPDGQIVFFP